MANRNVNMIGANGYGNNYNRSNMYNSNQFGGFQPYVHTPKFVGLPVEEYGKFYESLNKRNANIMDTTDALSVMLANEKVDPAFGNVIKDQHEAINKGIDNIVNADNYTNAELALRKMVTDYRSNTDLIAARNITAAHKQSEGTRLASYNAGKKTAEMYNYESKRNQLTNLDDYKMENGMYRDYTPKYMGTEMPNMGAMLNKYIGMFKQNVEQTGGSYYPLLKDMSAEDILLGLYKYKVDDTTAKTIATGIEDFISDKFLQDPNMKPYLQEEADILNDKTQGKPNPDNPDNPIPYTAADMAKVHTSGIQDAVQHTTHTYKKDQLLNIENYNQKLSLLSAKNNGKGKDLAITLLNGKIDVKDGSKAMDKLITSNKAVISQYTDEDGNLKPMANNDKTVYNNNAKLLEDYNKNYFANSPDADKTVSKIADELLKYSMFRIPSNFYTQSSSQFSLNNDATIETVMNPMLIDFLSRNNLYDDNGGIDKKHLKELLSTNSGILLDKDVYVHLGNGEDRKFGKSIVGDITIADLLSAKENTGLFAKNPITKYNNENEVSTSGTVISIVDPATGKPHPYAITYGTEIQSNPASYNLANTNETLAKFLADERVTASNYNLHPSPVFAGVGLQPYVNVHFEPKAEIKNGIKIINDQTLYPNQNSTQLSKNIRKYLIEDYNRTDNKESLFKAKLANINVGLLTAEGFEDAMVDFRTNNMSALSNNHTIVLPTKLGTSESIKITPTKEGYKIDKEGFDSFIITDLLSFFTEMSNSAQNLQ